jgi:hypothetical protein
VGDKAKGIYDKFVVTRRDGKSKRGQKHFGCRYFVLDIDHDQHAIAALGSYMNSCAEEYPLLAADLLRIIKEKTGMAR